MVVGAVFEFSSSNLGMADTARRLYLEADPARTDVIVTMLTLLESTQWQ